MWGNGNVFSMFFSFQGRLNRQPFWIRIFLVNITSSIVASIAGSVTGESGQDPSTYYYLIYTLYWIAISSLWMRRMQDMGTSGWYFAGVAFGAPASLIFRIWVVELMAQGSALGETLNMPSIVLPVVVLVAALYVFVKFGFSRGTVGENEFGKDPLAKELPKKPAGKKGAKKRKAVKRAKPAGEVRDAEVAEKKETAEAEEK